MKIGIVETGLPPYQIGGAEMQAWHLARHLAVKHDVIVFTRRFPMTKKTEIKDNVSIIRTSILPFPFGILSYIFGTAFSIFLNHKRLDVVLCFRAWPNGVIGLAVNKFFKIPFCFSIRGGDWYFVEPHFWGKLIFKWLFLNKSCVVVQAERIRDALKCKYPEVNPIVIPNGVDIDERTVRGDSLLFVGNLLWRKGLNVLFEALKHFPEIPVIIAGDGPERKTWERMASGMNVEFIGRLQPDQVKTLMVERGRILVLPAIAGEGFPNVLVEAMSVGLPVIASDIAGVPNLLEDGRAGILVRPNDVDSLGSAIRKLWKSERLIKEYSNAGKKASRKYSWEKITFRWEMLFREILNGKR
jgi:glycosyltransferase involved in cell wall biosynthesis